MLALWAVRSKERAKVADRFREVVVTEANNWIRSALAQGDAWQLLRHEVQWSWTGDAFIRGGEG